MEKKMEQPNSNTQNIPVVTPQTGQMRRRRPAKWLALGLLILMIGVASALLIRSNDGQDAQAVADVTVEVTASALQPETIKIKKGGSVTWINKDTAPHLIESDPYPEASTLPSLNSGEALSTGESYTHTFDETGTFTYHDQLNPSTLKGAVVVE